MTKLKEVSGEVYGFWARIGDWIGRHSRTMLGLSLIAVVALLIAVALR